MSEQLDAVFIEVEVSREAASDPELAKKLEEVCPVDIFAAARRRGRDRARRTSTSACSASSASRRRRPARSSSRKLYDGTELRR